MKMGCYTCGHNVFRLKDTTYRLNDSEFYLPDAEEIFNSYFDGTEIIETSRTFSSEVFAEPAA